MTAFHSKAEEELYIILKSIFGDYEPLHVNFRPKWLQRRETERSRLEIDFWFPRLRLAIELQGPQHYKQVGLASGLKNIQRRDAWKRERIRALGYKLVEVKTSEIKPDIVRQKIGNIISPKDLK